MGTSGTQDEGNVVCQNFVAGLTAAGLIFFHMCLIMCCFGVRCLHLLVSF
jgi:hypothetical protein